MKDMGWRVSLSIAAAVGWLIFLIVWLFFYAGQYSPYKNIALILASLLILGFILGVPWAIWGRRYMKPEDREQMSKPGFRWRTWASGIIALVIFIGLIYWFFTYADAYTVYQNIAILIIALLLFGGIMGAMWAPWGMKYGRQH
jgi:MFS family permease